MVELILEKYLETLQHPLRYTKKFQKESLKIFNHLERQFYEVYEVPFDVRLPTKSKKNEDIDKVV